MTDIEGEAPLGVSITGPGPAHAELADSGNGSTEVHCTARTAGDYVLSVFDLASGASLFGSPFKVTSVLVAYCRTCWPSWHDQENALHSDCLMLCMPGVSREQAFPEWLLQRTPINAIATCMCLKMCMLLPPHIRMAESRVW